MSILSRLYAPGFDEIACTRSMSMFAKIKNCSLDILILSVVYMLRQKLLTVQFVFNYAENVEIRSVTLVYNTHFHKGW